MTTPPKRHCSRGPLGPFFSITSNQPSFRAEQADFSASVRSCERIGPRSETSSPSSVFCEEKSLFDVPSGSVRSVFVSGPFFSELCVLCVSVPLCVKSLSFLFPSTHYPLLTTHWFNP